METTLLWLLGGFDCMCVASFSARSWQVVWFLEIQLTLILWITCFCIVALSSSHFSHSCVCSAGTHADFLFLPSNSLQKAGISWFSYARVEFRLSLICSSEQLFGTCSKVSADVFDIYTQFCFTVNFGNEDLAQHMGLGEARLV